MCLEREIDDPQAALATDLRSRLGPTRKVINGERDSRPTSGRNDQSRADPPVTSGPEAKSKRNHELKVELYGAIRIDASRALDWSFRPDVGN
jgi:hypothetical protein